MSIEQQIEGLEEEIKALKCSFSQSANSMKIYTVEKAFETKANIVRASNPNPYNPLEWSAITSIPKNQNGDGYGRETILATFNCLKGINTFASLEFTVLAPSGLNIISTKRVPYAGGARWQIEIRPNVTMDGGTGFYIWSTTKLHFAVQSAAEGTLEVKMIWE